MPREKTGADGGYRFEKLNYGSCALSAACGSTQELVYRVEEYAIQFKLLHNDGFILRSHLGRSASAWMIKLTSRFMDRGLLPNLIMISLSWCDRSSAEPVVGATIRF
jgi:hypothetical protein